VSRTRCSVQRCSAAPGPRTWRPADPGSAAHRHSASKTRVHALTALRSIRRTRPMARNGIEFAEPDDGFREGLNPILRPITPSSFRGARSASFDVQLHIRESILTIVVMDSGPAPSGASTMCNCTSGNDECCVLVRSERKRCPTGKSPKPVQSLSKKYFA
jgi:hypothetical protein